ncbi:MAG: SLC13/DASS family transporter [Myxococcales bacterium]|nr:SLC13/DASS family transporter [Myxococcales bacterium]
MDPGLGERLAGWAEAFDRLQESARWRWGGSLAGAVLASPFFLTTPPDGLQPVAWRCAGVAAWMAFAWVLGTLPTAVTALVPLFAFPLLGIRTIRETATAYADPLLFLLVGGFFLGHAMQRVGLHERLVSLLLRPGWTRTSPRRVLLATMIAAATMSTFVSNTATVVMLLPLTTLLADRVGTPRSRSAFGLGLSFAASIGGVATPIGTFPNAVLVKMASEQVGREVSFASWMLVGVPFVVLAVPIAWVIVGRWLLPARGAPVRPLPTPAWRSGEASVLGVLALGVLGWVFRRPIDLGFVRITGWSEALGMGKAVDDAWVALGVAILLFLLPAGDRPLITFREAERQMPWGVIFLLGGGFALAEGLESTGLSTWLAGPVASMADWPAPLLIATVCLLVTGLSELTSNTATTQMVLPLLAAGAIAAGVDPLSWMVPATIAASCGFMMPISTPPNAIVAEGLHIPPRDMATTGLLLDVALVALATVVGLVLVPLVL